MVLDRLAARDAEDDSRMDRSGGMKDVVKDVAGMQDWHWQIWLVSLYPETVDRMK